MNNDYRTIRNNLVETYNRYAIGRDKRKKTPSGGTEPLDRFIALMKEQSKVTLLDIGAGNGVDSRYFKGKGISAICGDLAIEHAKLCCEKELPACVTDICDLGFRDASFDAVWAVQCLFHLPKHMLPKALDGVRRVLKPGGLFYISVGGGPDREEIWEDDYFSPPRFFSFSSDETIRKTMADFFSILSFEAQPTRLEEIHQQVMILQKVS